MSTGPDKRHRPLQGALDLIKFIGPGFLVTVGFIDPGNWAANIAAGSQFGWSLLWVVTLSTLMLVVIQHNAAHLGIATGLCLSEAARKHMRAHLSIPFIATGVAAASATILAEILGAAIGLNMLTGLPLPAGAVFTSLATIAVTFTHGYRLVEKYIIGAVSLIGAAFVYELWLVKTPWASAAYGWTVPTFPTGSLPIILCVLGAVVMPHNIFLHSEVIQSRQWNLGEESTIRNRLKYEFTDTILAMGVGWAINSAMLLVAAAVFFSHNIPVVELQQAKEALRPLLGGASSAVFAIALLFAGFASSITASMAAGSIFAGFWGEPLDLGDSHSRLGVIVATVPAVLLVFVIGDPFKGLVWSQVALSIQLPLTIIGLIALTSSKKVMGIYSNGRFENAALLLIGAVVIGLNIALLASILG